MRLQHLPWLLLLWALAAPLPLVAQTREGERRAEASRFLGAVHADLKRSYYDRDFRGVNLEVEYDSARARLTRASSDQERFHAIEVYLQRLNDSHTYFVSPRRIGLADYNLGIRFFGESAFVVRVDAGSNAEAVGVRAGDEIVQFAGQTLGRDNARDVLTDFLSSHPIRVLDLTLRAPDRSITKVSVKPDTAAIYRIRGKQLRQMISLWRDSSELATSHVQASIADTVFYWRLPQFTHADKGLDAVIKRARNHQVLVLDLRGNGGGSIATLTRLVGYFVDTPLTVGELHTRIGVEKFVAKPAKERFAGLTLIIVDSETASASEIFARLMQLAGKATVYGDRTAGAVMASQFFRYSEDAGASVTVSDFALHNGERLEKVGVRPDLLLIPPPQHIGKGTDIVLAYVLAKAGARVSPAAAATLVVPR